MDFDIDLQTATRAGSFSHSPKKNNPGIIKRFTSSTSSFNNAANTKEKSLSDSKKVSITRRNEQINGEDDRISKYIPRSPSLLLTSPDGKVKQLLPKYRGGVAKSQVKVSIPSNSPFWLPKVPSKHPSTVEISEQELDVTSIEKKDGKEKDEDFADVCLGFDFVSYNNGRNLSLPILEKLNDALVKERLKLECGNDILFTCATLDDNCIAITKETIIVFNNTITHFLCVATVCKIHVDSNYDCVCFLLESESPEYTILEIIPQEPLQTEPLLSALHYAFSLSTAKAHRNVIIETQTLPMFKLSSNKLVMQMVRQYDSLHVIYNGFAYVETVDLKSKVDDDIMMQIDSRDAQPVNLSISENFLLLKVSSPVDSKESLKLNIEDITSMIIRTETARPLSIDITFGSPSITTKVNLSSSNTITINEVFSRLRYLKDFKKNSTVASQPALLILTKNTFFVFSIGNAHKELILVNPVLNFFYTGQPDLLSCLLVSYGNKKRKSQDATEAEESESGVRNANHLKCTFKTETNCQDFINVITTASNSFDQD